MKKRLFALLMTMALVLSMFVGMSFAAEEKVEWEKGWFFKDIDGEKVNGKFSAAYAGLAYQPESVRYVNGGEVRFSAFNYTKPPKFTITFPKGASGNVGVFYEDELLGTAVAVTPAITPWYQDAAGEIDETKKTMKLQESLVYEFVGHPLMVGTGVVIKDGENLLTSGFVKSDGKLQLTVPANVTITVPDYAPYYPELTISCGSWSETLFVRPKSHLLGPAPGFTWPSVKTEGDNYVYEGTATFPDSYVYFIQDGYKVPGGEGRTVPGERIFRLETPKVNFTGGPLYVQETYYDDDGGHHYFYLAAGEVKAAVLSPEKIQATTEFRSGVENNFQLKLDTKGLAYNDDSYTFLRVNFNEADGEGSVAGKYFYNKDSNGIITLEGKFTPKVGVHGPIKAQVEVIKKNTYTDKWHAVYTAEHVVLVRPGGTPAYSLSGLEPVYAYGKEHVVTLNLREGQNAVSDATYYWIPPSGSMEKAPVSAGKLTIAADAALGGYTLYGVKGAKHGVASFIVDNVIVDKEPPTVTYKIVDGDAVITIKDNQALSQVFVNRNEVLLESDKEYVATLPLKPGMNEVIVWAVDQAGNLLDTVLEIVLETEDVVVTAEFSPDLGNIQRQGENTFIQLREFEDLGAQVGWNGETRVATFIVGDTVVKVTIGSKTALVNDVAKEMPAAAYIDAAQGRTYIPLRFVSEQLGWNVHWRPGDFVTIKLG